MAANTKLPIALVLALFLCCLPLISPSHAEDKPAVPDTERFEELWRIGTQWQVGKIVEEVAQAREELIALGEPALDWMLKEHLGVSNTLEIRALDTIVLEQAELSVVKLREYLDHWDELSEFEKYNTVRLIGRLDDSESLPRLKELLSREAGPRLVRTLIETLGKLGGVDEIDVIAQFLTDDNERTRLSAILALRAIGDPYAISDLLNSTSDESYVTRFAAADAAVALGPLAGSLVSVLLYELAEREIPREEREIPCADFFFLIPNEGAPPELVRFQAARILGKSLEYLGRVINSTGEEDSLPIAWQNAYSGADRASDVSDAHNARGNAIELQKELLTDDCWAVRREAVIQIAGAVEFNRDIRADLRRLLHERYKVEENEYVLGAIRNALDRGG